MLQRLFAVLLLAFVTGPADAEDHAPVAIAIHGGAGTISRELMTPEREAAFREALE